MIQFGRIHAAVQPSIEIRYLSVTAKKLASCLLLRYLKRKPDSQRADDNSSGTDRVVNLEYLLLDDEVSVCRQEKKQQSAVVGDSGHHTYLVSLVIHDILVQVRPKIEEVEE